jgi:hypothetical protein
MASAISNAMSRYTEKLTGAVSRQINSATTKMSDSVTNAASRAVEASMGKSIRKSAAYSTTVVGIPFLAFGFLLAGLGSTAAGEATATKAEKSQQVGQSMAAAFYLSASIALIAIAIALFVYQSKHHRLLFK